MKKVIAFGFLLMPFVAGAQIAKGASTVAGLIAFLKDFLSTATVLILAATVVFFLWNVFGYVMSAGDPEKRAEKQSGIIYGVIGIAVMVSLWGLVSFLTTSANLKNEDVGRPPSLAL